MPTVSATGTSLVLNSKSTDQLSGTDIQFMPFDGIVSLWARGSADGMNLTLTLGADVAVNDQELPYFGTTGGLSQEDHLIESVRVAAGSKLALSFRNTTGGTLTVDWKVTATPL